MCFDAAGERFGPRMKLRHFQRELAPLLPILTSAGIAKTSLTSLSTPSFLAPVVPSSHSLKYARRLCANCATASCAWKLFFLLFSISSPLLSPFMPASSPALPS